MAFTRNYTGLIAYLRKENAVHDLILTEAQEYIL